MSTSSEIGEAGAAAIVEPSGSRNVSLCEALDRMLNTGVVAAGEVVISVAGIDLIYLNLQLLLASVETACGPRRAPVTAASNTTSEP